jgi:pyrimidine operon attenuation protein/uracil phosphoribosyltransferase
MDDYPLPPTPDEIEAAIGNLAEDIASRHNQTETLAIIGIANGGIALAQSLKKRIDEKFGRNIPTGSVDIAFHRDDLAKNPIPKFSDPTDIPVEVDGADIILVDDVLYTGRSVRAAVNELFDIGRPSRIELAVLYDRGGRKLPISPDYCAFVREHSNKHQVEITLDPDNPQAHAITIS